METRKRLKQFHDRLFAMPGRQARPASVSFNLFKTLVQTLGMWTVFLALGPFLAFQLEEWLELDRFQFSFRWQNSMGALLFLCGWLVAWSSAYFMVSRGDGTPLPLDSTRKLVIAGPYRFVRNPMAFASLLQGAAIGLMAGSPLVLIYIFVGALAWNYLARPWEEADLARKFGAEYLHYKSEVKCWAPRLRPYSPDSHHVLSSRSTISPT